jgi:hypothetical protein
MATTLADAEQRAHQSALMRSDPEELVGKKLQLRLLNAEKVVPGSVLDFDAKTKKYEISYLSGQICWVSLEHRDFLLGSSDDEDDDHRGGNSDSDDESNQRALIQKPAASWVNDEQATQCTACATEFSFFWRKHHCRRCGNVFCGTCSDYFAPLPQNGFWNDVRQCSKCFQLTKDSKERANEKKHDGESEDAEGDSSAESRKKISIFGNLE